MPAKGETLVAYRAMYWEYIYLYTHTIMIYTLYNWYIYYIYYTIYCLLLEQTIQRIMVKAKKKELLKKHSVQCIYKIKFNLIIFDSAISNLELCFIVILLYVGITMDIVIVILYGHCFHQ